MSLPPPATLAEAAALQRALAERVRLAGAPAPETLIALDASSLRGGALVAAAVLWSLPEARVLELGFASMPDAESFPYVSGFLSFREAPVYLRALEQLSREPELLLVDGQGVAHPRRLGIAAHLGVVLSTPSIGVAKSRLYGQQQGELGAAKGSAAPLVAKGEQLGWVYRSRAGVKPLYLSPGHLVGLAAALELVRGLPGHTKLPEPLRQAHQWAGRARREGLSGRLTP